MILDNAQIKALAKAEVDIWIKEARQDSKRLKMHFFGEHKNDFLTKIDGLENETQIQLRRTHAPSNKDIVENLLRPFDNVWSAKGGLIAVQMNSESLQERFDQTVRNVKNGKSIAGYLKDIWSNSLFTDPAGLLFMELSKSGEKAYLTQKSIMDIKNMKLSGVNPEYVVFEYDEMITEDGGIKTNKIIQGRKSKSKVKKRLWIIDDAFYYRVEIQGNDVLILEQIDNSFEKVPAIINSPILDTNRKIPVSPIWKQVEQLDVYLSNNSVKEIYQFLHGYPIFYMYARQCDDCNGSGEIWTPHTEDDGGEYSTCKTCSGSGRSKKKDVSDGIILAPPKDADSPTINDPAGYVQPGIDTWREQRTELDWKWNKIFYSHWGTTVERKNNETATGRFIDAQPVNNRLNDYSNIVEKVHKWSLEMFAMFIGENSVKTIIVNYGRRYLIETPDQIWKKYIESKEKRAPDLTLNLLLMQFYESEFRDNEQYRDYNIKLMQVEPYVHKSIEEVIALPISNQEKANKLYFQEWANQQMIADVLDSSVEELINNLSQYSLAKLSSN
jgi:hypothetical protein